MLFATHDEAVSALGPRQAEIDELLRRPWTPWPEVNAVMDKEHQHAVARASGFPVPATVTPRDEGDLEAAGRELRFPVVLKPRNAPAFRHRFHAHLLEAADPEALRRAWELAAPYDPQVCEVIPGDDSLLWTYGSYRDASGRALAAFTGRKLRQWPVGFGAARAAESRWDPGLAARCDALLDALGFHGISQVEVKRDPRDGRDHLIEVNARPWLWIGLATACGVNLPLACWLDAVGRPREWPPGHRDGRRWVLLSKHLVGSAREIRRGQWSAGPFLRSLAPPVARRRDRRPRPAPRPRPLRAPRPAAGAPWLTCASASTAAAPRSRRARAGCSRRWPRAWAGPPAWTDGEADLVYAPGRPAGGVWIPADPGAQAFFEGPGAFPGPAVHRPAGLTLLFPPTHPGEPVPGDLVASAFYLLARWDELRVAERDRFGRLPLAASAFGRIAGLELADPPVEGYLDALRAALRIPPPTRWGVALTHDIDRLRRRTPKGLAGIARRRGAARAGRRPGRARPVGQPPRPARDDLAARAALDGLPDRPQPPPSGRDPAPGLRARAPGARRRRARGGGRGGPARLLRGGRRPRGAGRRAGLAARRGRAGGGGPVPLPAVPVPRERARPGARRGGVRLQPGLQRGARVRRRHRSALPPLAGGGGAPGAPHPAARWR